MSKTSSRTRGRTVKATLADGSTKTYRYPPYRTKPRARGDTVDDLVKAWQGSPEWRSLSDSTQKLYTHYLRPLTRIGTFQAAQVERRQVTFIRNSIASSSGHGAANAFTKVTSSLFSWAVEIGWLKQSPVLRMKRLKGGELPAWTEADAQLALEHLPEHLRRVVVLALYTGQRRGDLIALPWAAYDGKKIRLVQQKTHKPMVIPCHPSLQVELNAWRQGAVAGIGQAPILLNAKGKPWAPNDVTTHLGNALSAIPGFPKGRNIHGVRKLAATNLAHAGCTLHEVASITGHTTLAMVQLYTASADQERLAEAAVFRLTTNAEKTGKT